MRDMLVRAKISTTEEPISRLGHSDFNGGL
jgi:hypothetical protein